MNIIVPTVGWVDVSETFEQVLEATIQMVRDAQTAGDAAIDALLVRIYANYSDDKRAAIKLWLASHQWPIVQSSPRLDKEVPCWVISLGTGENTMQYLGEAVANGNRGERWRDSVGVVTIAEDTNVLKWLHQLSIFGLSRARTELGQIFVHGQRPSHRDLPPVELQGGRFLRQRAIFWLGEYDQSDVDVDAVPVTVSEIDLAGNPATSFSPTGTWDA